MEGSSINRLIDIPDTGTSGAFDAIDRFYDRVPLAQMRLKQRSADHSLMRDSLHAPPAKPAKVTLLVICRAICISWSDLMRWHQSLRRSCGANGAGSRDLAAPNVCHRAGEPTRALGEHDGSRMTNKTSGE
jgi:hypothetical protein